MGSGSKAEQKIGAMSSEDYKKLSKALTKMPSIDGALKNMSKQTIKEFQLDDKDASVMKKVTNHEREQFNRLVSKLIDPPKKADIQNHPNRIPIN